MAVQLNAVDSDGGGVLVTDELKADGGGIDGVAHGDGRGGLVLDGAHELELEGLEGLGVELDALGRGDDVLGDAEDDGLDVVASGEGDVHDVGLGESHRELGVELRDGGNLRGTGSAGNGGGAAEGLVVVQLDVLGGGAEDAEVLARNLNRNRSVDGGNVGLVGLDGNDREGNGEVVPDRAGELGAEGGGGGGGVRSHFGGSVAEGGDGGEASGLGAFGAGAQEHGGLDGADLRASELDGLSGALDEEGDVLDAINAHDGDALVGVLVGVLGDSLHAHGELGVGGLEGEDEGGAGAGHADVDEEGRVAVVGIGEDPADALNGGIGELNGLGNANEGDGVELGGSDIDDLFGGGDGHGGDGLVVLSIDGVADADGGLGNHGLVGSLGGLDGDGGVDSGVAGGGGGDEHHGLDDSSTGATEGDDGLNAGGEGGLGGNSGEAVDGKGDRKHGNLLLVLVADADGGVDLNATEGGGGILNRDGGEDLSAVVSGDEEQLVAIDGAAEGEDVLYVGDDNGGLNGNLFSVNQSSAGGGGAGGSDGVGLVGLDGDGVAPGGTQDDLGVLGGVGEHDGPGAVLEGGGGVGASASVLGEVETGEVLRARSVGGDGALLASDGGGDGEGGGQIAEGDLVVTKEVAVGLLSNAQLGVLRDGGGGDVDGTSARNDVVGDLGLAGLAVERHEGDGVVGLGGEDVRANHVEVTDDSAVREGDVDVAADLVEVVAGSDAVVAGLSNLGDGGGGVEHLGGGGGLGDVDAEGLGLVGVGTQVNLDALDGGHGAEDKDDSVVLLIKGAGGVGVVIDEVRGSAGGRSDHGGNLSGVLGGISASVFGDDDLVLGALQHVHLLGLGDLKDADGVGGLDGVLVVGVADVVQAGGGELDADGGLL